MTGFVHNLGLPEQWSNKIHKLVNIAKLEAHLSEMKVRHGAILFNNQHVYQRTRNQQGTKFRRYLVPALHAEALCLRDLRHLRKVRQKHSNRLNILVVRINCQSQLTESKPCAMCIHLMKENRIGRVYYTNGHGQLCYIRVCYLEETHFSSGFITAIKNVTLNYLPISKTIKQLHGAGLKLTKTGYT